MMQVIFRPLPVWPHKPSQRRSSQFATPYPRTLAQLEREIGYLGGRDVTIGIGLEEFDIRQDGMPRANARPVGHPGVEVSFDTRDYGRQTYATDQFWDWRDNVRAVVLSLEALRAVERYGVSKGRQYAGFALLTAGPGLEEQGRLLVERFGSIKEALRHTHPDTGDADMTTREYQAVIAYRDAQAAVA